MISESFIVSGILIGQGAEGKVYRSTFIDRPCVEKVRQPKRYRVPELDTKLNKHRILQECRCMIKCLKAGISVPAIYFVDLPNNRIVLEYVNGITLKDFLTSHSQTGYIGECLEMAEKVGKAIGMMHDKDVVHGDLTTSNIMITDDTRQVVLIDFGLGAMQAGLEDKAVDLYVLERALISTHPGSEHLMSAILQKYRFSAAKGTLTLNKLDQVRLRGRKREMIG